MIKTMRKIGRGMAERRNARAAMRATEHLDDKMLRDVGISRYELSRKVYWL